MEKEQLKKNIEKQTIILKYLDFQVKEQKELIQLLKNNLKS